MKNIINEEDFSKDNSLISPSDFDFSNLLYNSLFSDFTIRVPNPPKDKPFLIPAHRFILNSYSDYFRKFFESSPNEKEIFVCFPDWATSGIYDILEHIYSGKVISFSVENISSIVCVAFTWSIESLKDQLLNFLNTKIPVNLSLPILTKILNYIPNDNESVENLVKSIGRGFMNFEKSQFESLPFNIFIDIIDFVISTQPDEKVSYNLCEAIENYFQKNIINIGSHEYCQLVKKFTMKANHNGIINLYKDGLIYGWNVKLAENKILNNWKKLNQKMLSQLPVQSLKRLLREDFLNVDSENDLVDFIFMVYQNRTPESDHKIPNRTNKGKSQSVSNFKSSFSTDFDDNNSSQPFFGLSNSVLNESSFIFDMNGNTSSYFVASDLYSSSSDEDDRKSDLDLTTNGQIENLWSELRLSFLSQSAIDKMNASPLVPLLVKKKLGQPLSLQQAPRLPRDKIKCLILGACDETSLRDICKMIMSTSFNDTSIVFVRADREFDINIIFEFHSILIFSFYTFWNREEVSKKLLQFHNEGGGVFICYGTHRNDRFGIGEPFLSCIPIEHIANPDLTTEFIVTDKRKTRYEGCKYMRVICRARKDGIVESCWDDGVPFLIRKGKTKDGKGAIYILNATPVSHDIFPEQWSSNDKRIQHLISNAIIYVSNVVLSKRDHKK